MQLRSGTCIVIGTDTLSLRVLRSLLGPAGQAHRLTEGDGRPMDRPGESLPLLAAGPPQS